MAAAERPSPEPGSDAGIADIQSDIERTRGELGDTVEALSGKFDVTGRARAAAKPSLVVVASVAGVTVVGLIWWRRRSRHRH
jgi:hypothetical protein